MSSSDRSAAQDQEFTSYQRHWAACYPWCAKPGQHPGSCIRPSDAQREREAAHVRERPREETEARLLRERGTPEERIGPVVPDGTLYSQGESVASTDTLQLAAWVMVLSLAAAAVIGLVLFVVGIT